MSGRVSVALLLMAVMVGVAGGQQNKPATSSTSQSAPLTNADVVRMVRAGISTRTIELEIKSRPNKFDTSPEALIHLQRMRVNASILDAMVMASEQKNGAAASATLAATPAKPLTGEEMIAKALNAIGPHDRLIAIHAVRWTASAIQNAAAQPGVTLKFVEEGVREYPGLEYVGVQEPSGKWEKVVVTPGFAYRDSRAMTIAVPQARAEQYRDEMEFDPVYIAQHMEHFIFTAAGTEDTKSGAVDVLQISADGMTYVWRMDAKSGELLEAKHEVPSGEVTVEYSDYRKVDGLTLPFKRRTVTQDGITVLSVNAYQVNPNLDGAMFLEPSSLSSAAESLKVLASDTIQVSQGLDGWNSANCQLQVSPGPANYPSTLDDVAFAQAQPGANMKLLCNSWDENTIIPRSLNAMLVVSSDGNAYVIGCQKAWHFSKCTELDKGRMFHGSRRSDGFDVYGPDANGKDVRAHYEILITKALE